jgi:hypothetical protein
MDTIRGHWGDRGHRRYHAPRGWMNRSGTLRRATRNHAERDRYGGLIATVAIGGKFRFAHRPTKNTQQIKFWTSSRRSSIQ